MVTVRKQVNISYAFDFLQGLQPGHSESQAYRVTEIYGLTEIDDIVSKKNEKNVVCKMELLQTGTTNTLGHKNSLRI